MDRLFKSFSQVDASTTRKYGGTGLGLAISKKLAELMGGTMWVESAGLGHGSTFHFTLQAPIAPFAAQLPHDTTQLQGRRVLIVDDNATNRRLLTLQTQAWGMAPRAYATPAEALESLRTGESFDIGLLDMQMPEMDGLMLARAIRQQCAHLPLALLSSLGQREISLEEGLFVAALTKPIKASQLLSLLLNAWATTTKTASPPMPAPTLFNPKMGQRYPLRLLLAEDNAINQKLVLRLLERLGYRADLAGNGLEALESLERQPYDVVLMDVQMPEMDGLEASRRIRAGRFVPAPRIVALTANALQEDREMCLAAGMDDYLSKPIRVEELTAALQGCWEQLNPAAPRASNTV
jgi:CheY-like chemotaxis protein